MFPKIKDQKKTQNLILCKYINNGKLIAKNLLRNGYKLKIYEINPEIQKNIVVIEGGKEYSEIEQIILFEGN